MDELEYLLEELQIRAENPNFQVICASLDDLIGKSCKGANSHSNSFFGLQLKSHGVLLQIFESLAPGGELVEDERVHLRLAVLVGHLLPDVRRLDFFVPGRSALKLARSCLNFNQDDWAADENWRLLERSPVFTNSGITRNHSQFLAVWILTKMTLASLNLPGEDRFCDVLAAAEDVFARLTAGLFEPFEESLRDRTAALLDALFTFASVPIVVPCDLIPRILKEARMRASVFAFKFAASLTGSAEGARFLSRSSAAEWLPTMQLLLSGSQRDERDKTDEADEADEIIHSLALSCFVNLVDRVPEAVLDELRAFSLLQKVAGIFCQSPSLLSALAVVFSCAPCNKTNAEVIKAAWQAEKKAELAVQVRKLIEAFLATKEGQRKRIKLPEEGEQQQRLEAGLGLF